MQYASSRSGIRAATGAVLIILLLLIPLVAGCTDNASPTFPGEEWPTSTLQKQGMDPEPLEEMMHVIEQNDIKMHAVVVIRNGQIVFEEYLNGWLPQMPHHIQSVTKSFTSTLIGIALRQGLIDSLDQPVLDFFPDLEVENVDERKERLTLRHLLTMSDGMDWHEVDVPYDDPRNTLGQMWVSRDSVKHVLDTPMAREPGERFSYNSGTSILLGGILEQVTGSDVLSYARENLFGPLGIEKLQWSKTRGNHYHTDGGLYLTPRDMARLGYLMLRGGTWDGQEIVSESWVTDATSAHYETPWGSGYGYQWWTIPGTDIYQATGHYEQKIYVVPGADMVIVFTAHIADEDPHPTDGFVLRYILPAVTDTAAGATQTTYAAHGFRFDYPAGWGVTERPLPGEDEVTDATGTVQFTFQSFPFEVVSVVWGEAEAGDDLEGYLDAVLASAEAQPGTSITLGERSDGEVHGHSALFQDFAMDQGGGRFAGRVAAWHCPETGRAYVFTYATDGDSAGGDVEDRFSSLLGGFACHD